MDGRRRTNATWTQPGYSPKYHANWWNSKPRLHRLAWRNGIFWTSFILIWLFAYPSTRIVAVLAVWAALWVAADRTYLYLRGRKPRVVTVDDMDRLPPEIEQSFIDNIEPDEDDDANVTPIKREYGS